MEIEYKQIGDQVKMLRKERGKSQVEFAKEIDVTETHYNQIETGRTAPSIKLLKTIALKTNTQLAVVFIKK